MKFKDNFLFIEIAKVKPKAANPNKINFTSPYRLEPLRFMNYSPGLGHSDHSEENDLRVEFKRTVRNSQQNSQQNSKRRTPVVVNAHPENQTFSKYQ